MVKERIVRYMKKDVINLGSWEEEFVLDFPVPLQLVMSVLMIEKQRTIPQRQEEAMWPWDQRLESRGCKLRKAWCHQRNH